MQPFDIYWSAKLNIAVKFKNLQLVSIKADAPSHEMMLRCLLELWRPCVPRLVLLFIFRTNSLRYAQAFAEDFLADGRFNMMKYSYVS